MKVTCIMIAFLLTITNLFGQQPAAKTPAKEQGYWVLEGNISTPLVHTIRFYNADNTLIGIQQLGGVKLNINRRRTRKQLDKQLDQTLIAWFRQNNAETASR